MKEEREYYENLKPDWVQIQKDKNDAEVLYRLRIELREGFMKHAVEYLSGNNGTGAKLLSMLTKGKPQTAKEYTWPILKT